MPGNVEIKARVKNMEDLKNKARDACDQHFKVKQTDVFFKTVNGCRLKLRTETNETTGETRSMLIAYERPDVTGPKFSYYILSNIPDPASMEDLLDLSNGTIGKVVKDREVFIVTKGDLTARVHLDDVKDLGEFLEFEVIVPPEASAVPANEYAEQLSEYFGISTKDHVSGAYFNLLEEKLA